MSTDLMAKRIAMLSGSLLAGYSNQEDTTPKQQRAHGPTWQE